MNRIGLLEEYGRITHILAAIPNRPIELLREREREKERKRERERERERKLVALGVRCKLKAKSSTHFCN